jgi:hypothetical protein
MPFALDVGVFAVEVVGCSPPVTICLTLRSAFRLPNVVRPFAYPGGSVLLFLAARRMFPGALILLLANLA